jgi:hypothetical protein
MRLRIVIISVFIALAAAGYLFPRIALNASYQSSQQDNRRRQTTRRARTNQSQSRRKPARDYSKFSHRTAEHQGSCSTCHKAPTANWLKASAFPDVADYPAHASCTSCHRTEFFKGARPVICSICHTQVSPRDDDRFLFDKPNQPSQFSAIFPHDKHQDIIAAHRFDNGIESAHAKRSASSAQDASVQQYNDCASCHETQTNVPNPPGGFPDSFQPLAGTFKTSPVGHASCFNCHWKNAEPTHNECAGCHRLSQTDIAMLPAPKRITLKFNHTLGDHVTDCTTCHTINIRGADSLRGLNNPDVPITACARCHLATTSTKAAFINADFEQRDSNASFACTKCHTSEVGKRDKPASHRALVIK